MPRFGNRSRAIRRSCCGRCSAPGRSISTGGSCSAFPRGRSPGAACSSPPGGSIMPRCWRSFLPSPPIRFSRNGSTFPSPPPALSRRSSVSSSSCDGGIRGSGRFRVLAPESQARRETRGGGRPDVLGRDPARVDLPAQSPCRMQQVLRIKFPPPVFPRCPSAGGWRPVPDDNLEANARGLRNASAAGSRGSGGASRG